MTKEQFFLEMENWTKELEKIQEKLREIRAQGDLSENEEYDRLRKRQHEIHDVVEWYEALCNPKTAYRYLLSAYKDYVEYSKKHDLEPLDFPNDKVSILQKHLRKDELVSVDLNYDSAELWELINCCKDRKSYLEDDFNKVYSYFKNKKEDDIYKWDLECVTFLLFYDQVCQTSYCNELFGNYKELKKSKKCEEYNSNYDKLFKGLENNTFSFNLFLWTIFKTYHYFYNKNSELIIDKSDLVLIDKLITLGVIVFSNRSKKWTIKENPKLKETDFIFGLSQLVCLDMIHTIYKDFPDYYDTCIMFLGYGLYIPGGCSALSTSMKNFDKFVDGITNYDFWLECEGPEIFEKMNIEYDYEKVLKDNQN